MTTTESLKKTGRPQFDARRLLAHAALIVGALVMIYPLLWMLASSLKPEDQIFTDLSLVPEELVLSNYVEGWSAAGQSFGRYFINSLIVCVGAVAGNLIACSMAAYAFARLNFRFKRVWFALMLLTIMLPQHVTLIPQYAIFLGLDWVNTYLPLVVPKFLATDAFFIFLMVQFIRGFRQTLTMLPRWTAARPSASTGASSCRSWCPP